MSLHTTASETTPASGPVERPACALDAFIATRHEIDTLFERLRVLSAGHFATNPEEVSWDHVGTLSLYRDRLRELTDMAFGEGEYAR